jgi:hypothetical protein
MNGNLINDMYININSMDNSDHKRPHSEPSRPNKASALNNMTKSFNDIYQGLKIENLEHMKGVK